MAWATFTRSPTWRLADDRNLCRPFELRALPADADAAAVRRPVMAEFTRYLTVLRMGRKRKRNLMKFLDLNGL